MDFYNNNSMNIVAQRINEIAVLKNILENEEADTKKFIRLISELKDNLKNEVNKKDISKNQILSLNKSIDICKDKRLKYNKLLEEYNKLEKLRNLQKDELINIQKEIDELRNAAYQRIAQINLKDNTNLYNQQTNNINNNQYNSINKSSNK